MAYLEEISTIVKLAKKVKNSKPISKKPKINPVNKLVNILHKKGVGVSTIYESKETMIPMLRKYSKKLGYKKGEKKFIKEVITKLAKLNG